MLILAIASEWSVNGRGTWSFGRGLSSGGRLVAGKSGCGTSAIEPKDEVAEKSERSWVCRLCLRCSEARFSDLNRQARDCLFVCLFARRRDLGMRVKEHPEGACVHFPSYSRHLTRRRITLS